MANCIVMDVVKLGRMPGVADLPLSVRGKFAMALYLEQCGDAAGASDLLDKVLAAEDGPLPGAREVVEEIR